MGKGPLIRDLWEFRFQDDSPDDSQREWQKSAQTPWKELMKSRESGELKACLSALRSGDLERHCWLVSDEDVPMEGEVVSPHLLCARAFRWPDLTSSFDLQRLDAEASVCSTGAASSDGRVCCSPFHFARPITLGECCCFCCRPPLSS